MDSEVWGDEVELGLGMGVGSISPNHWAEGAAGEVTLFPHNWEGVKYCVSFPFPPRERLLLESKVANSGSV